MSHRLRTYHPDLARWQATIWMDGSLPAARGGCAAPGGAVAPGASGAATRASSAVAVSPPQAQTGSQEVPLIVPQLKQPDAVALMQTKPSPQSAFRAHSLPLRTPGQNESEVPNFAQAALPWMSVAQAHDGDCGQAVVGVAQ